MAAAVWPGVGSECRGEDVSAAPILQVFDARWDTIDDRMADIFSGGYGRLWLPPPARADSGGQSVGYDVYDRFDLGSPRNETLYGTEAGLKSLVRTAHTAGISVNTDFIPNHNGFSDSSTVDNFGTPDDPSDDVSFVEAGGYPGFVLSHPGTSDGDFHSRFESGEETFRLAGLIDINQSLNIQLIRTPVDPNNPQNIPAGTGGIFGRPPANVPDLNNARFYPDQDLGGTTVFDPRLNQNVTLYDFNRTTPLAGDAVSENALGLIVRNARWMIQEVGVDGFRIDAARHFPRWVLDFIDQGIFLASDRTHLDGSPMHAFSFSETGGDASDQFVADFIRKDIDNNNLGQLGGNRDSLDFNLFFDIRANLSADGNANDWRNIKNSSVDRVDDGFANNGSQGVAFAQSHDDGPSHLNNVANAYLAMRPGNWNVYINADEFDNEFRDFPKPGREDALGGLYGETMTTLVGIRNTHGRGNYLDRTPGGDEKEILIYERERSALVVLSNRLDGGFDARTVQTSFAPGTPLIELTGNAANSVVDPFNDFPELLVVKSDGTVDLRVARNRSPGENGVEHGNGYLIYGVAKPQGEMTLRDANGDAITQVLAGSTPMAGDGGPNGPSDNVLNGTTRLTDITVVQDPTVKLRIETNAVNLLGTVRDRHADGDAAQFRINEGRDAAGNADWNGSGGPDNPSPSSVGYAFEDFTDVNSPGFFDPSGDGLYEQTIDVSRLSEGRHYLTGRVYRHRNPDTFTDEDESTRGDGGPAVFEEWRKVIYVDLLPPESEIVSYEPFASDPGNTSNRDLIVRSVDGTANSIHTLTNIGAGLTDTEVLQLALNGGGATSRYDTDTFVSGQFRVITGNHAITIVTFEPTFDGTRGFNIQRVVGVEMETNRGLGLGDLDGDSRYETAEMAGFAGSFEEILYSNNQQFNPAADGNGDGLVDNRDLFALGQALIDGGARAVVLEAYEGVLTRRGDLNANGSTDADDLRLLYDSLGDETVQVDVDANGVVELADAQAFVTQILRTEPGDYNLDGTVDAADFTVWRDALASGDLAADGNFDGAVDDADYDVWKGAFGFARTPFASLESAAAAAPEPTAIFLLMPAAMAAAGRRRRVC